MTIENPFLIQALAVILSVLIFNFIIKKFLLRLQNQFHYQNRIWEYSFVSALQKPLSYFFCFLAILISINLISIHLFHSSIPLMDTLMVVGPVIALGWFLIRWNKAIMSQMLHLSQSKKIRLTPSNLDLISKVATIFILFITILLLLDVTGHNVQTLVAFGGISGVALAFAAQQFISNFFGGLTVYLTQPFSIGESIQIPDRKVEGKVEEIGWYMTRIRNDEKKPIYVPNSIFNQTIVITPSRNTHQRLYVKIGLRYQDLGVVKPIVNEIRKMLKEHPEIDQTMDIKVFFISFTATALEIEVSAYISKPKNFDELKQDILINIAMLVVEKGAEIAAITNIVEIKGHLDHISLDE